GSFKQSEPERIIKDFTETKEGFTVDIEGIPDTKKAIERAYCLAQTLQKPLLVTGSFYLAAEVRSFFASY
ncbi:MAG TPA: tetrahydrofolate synthase, partial [Treponema sp.]|nr:tetrahydrofolate synthase [Treponema sp.]HRS04756.1 tetrahydrofolate synthase [Treponema sp.]